MKFHLIILLLWSPILSFTQDGSVIVNYGDQFVEAIQSNDKEETEKIINEIFSKATINSKGVERISGLLSSLKKELLPIEYHHSEVTEFEMSDGSISRILHIYVRKEGSKFWKDIQIRLDAKPPHKLAQLGFIAEVAEPVNLPNGSITQEFTLNWLNNYIDKLNEENDLCGSILVSKGSEVLLERYYGYEDIGKSRKIMKETSFNLGSGNKMFTSVLIADLVYHNKLNYEDKVSKYIPQLSKLEFGNKITIHHLLSHTSGIGEYWTKRFEKEDPALNSLSDYLPFILREDSVFEPGADFGYCNSNFILAGLIIENVTGQSYYDYVAKKIFFPLKMSSSFHYSESQYKQSIAQPHSRDQKGNWKLADEPFAGSSAGGGYSSVRDVWKFSQALVAGSIIPKKYVNEITSIKTENIPGALGYGYGMIIEKHQDVISFGHGGITYGVNFEYRYFPNLDITLVMFCNQDNGAYDDLKKNVIKLINGER